MVKKRVSERTIRRLSHYARCLRLAATDGICIVTSEYLSSRCGISSAAVRKDLSIFGEFGKQGSGYDVKDLLANIQRILGTEEPPSVIVVGAGNIGRALLESGLEGTGGYRYSAIFDIDTGKTGRRCGGIPVQHVEELQESIKSLGCVIAVVAVPLGHGQQVVDDLVAAGCSAILSFTLEPLTVPDHVELRYIEVSTELDILTHSLRRQD